MNFSRFSSMIMRSITHSESLMFFELDYQGVVIAASETAEKKIGKSTPLTGLNFTSFLTESARNSYTRSLSQDFVVVPLALKINEAESLKCKAFFNKLETGWLLIIEPQIFFASDALNEISLLNNQLTNINRELQKKNRELQEASEKIRQLRKMLPICSYCKKIRDDKGYWDEVETYITEHSETTFSHGICPACLNKNFPDLADEIITLSDKPEP